MRLSRILFPALLLSILPAAAQAESGSVTWIDGPATVEIGDVAQLEVPEGFRYTAADGARAMLESWQEPAPREVLGLAMPLPDPERRRDWYVVWEFRDIGRVPDDQAVRLNYYANDILENLGAEFRGEGGRVEKGDFDPDDPRSFLDAVAARSSLRWVEPLTYDPDARRLRWSLNGYESAKRVRSRHLGRRGVMFTDLALAPPNPDREITRPADRVSEWLNRHDARVAASRRMMEEYESLLAGFSFLPGSRYADFRSGDQSASVGLQGLVIETHAISRSAFARWKNSFDDLPRVARKLLMYGLLGMAGFFGAQRVRLRDQLKEDGLR